MVKYGVLGFWDLGRHFRTFYSVPEARQVFKNLPGAHGFVVIQYGPVASHGGLFCARTDGFSAFLWKRSWIFDVILNEFWLQFWM